MNKLITATELFEVYKEIGYPHLLKINLELLKSEKVSGIINNSLNKEYILSGYEPFQFYDYVLKNIGKNYFHMPFSDSFINKYISNIDPNLIPRGYRSIPGICTPDVMSYSFSKDKFYFTQFKFIESFKVRDYYYFKDLYDDYGIICDQVLIQFFNNSTFKEQEIPFDFSNFIKKEELNFNIFFIEENIKYLKNQAKFYQEFLNDFNNPLFKKFIEAYLERVYLSIKLRNN